LIYVSRFFGRRRNLTVITDPLFYLLAIPAVTFLGLSKGGFAGLGMLATPLLALIVPPLEAAAILLPILIVQDAISVWTYHRAWSAWNLKVLLPGSVFGGGWLFARYFSNAAIELTVGTIALTFVLYVWLGARLRAYLGRPPLKPQRPNAAMGVFWGTMSGFTSTLIQVGGPPFQIHMLPQHLEKFTLVGTTVIFFTIVNWMIEKAAGLWGKAGQRSLARSALVEAVEQLTRALDQIATLPARPALRREEIRLQVALLNSLFHVKGYAAPETKAAVERARLLIEQAEALGEPLEDPLLLFAVLYGLFVQNIVAFNGDVCRDLTSHFLSLAEKQGGTVPLMIGHRIMGVTLVHTGNFAEGRAHLDRAFALYDPIEHRALAPRFGTDTGVTIFGFRSMALWYLGYPEAALADADSAIRVAREIGQAATLMTALATTPWTQNLCGNYAAARSFADELVVLAAEKGAAWWKVMGRLLRGGVFALTGRADAVETITSGLAALRSTGAATHFPSYLSYLARAQADIGRFDDACRSIDDAMATMETTKERMFEAEIYRTSGGIALMAPKPDMVKAEAFFERALAIARQQQAKSWELRAAMSLARLWRDQGKMRQASELLAPVYGWFTEGFETRDLKEAKALLEQLTA
jgi:predicted ATPase/uncharacterized membrane protein YfcA